MGLNYYDELDMPGTQKEEQARYGQTSFAGMPEKPMMVPYNKLGRLSEASCNNQDMNPKVWSKDYYESKNRSNRA